MECLYKVGEVYSLITEVTKYRLNRVGLQEVWKSIYGKGNRSHNLAFYYLWSTLRNFRNDAFFSIMFVSLQPQYSGSHREQFR